MASSSPGLYGSPRAHSLILKYDSTGQQVWVRPFAGPNGEEGAIAAFAMDPEGSFVAAGLIAASSSVLKYSPEGSVLWSRRGNGRIEALAVDPSGNVYIASVARGLDNNAAWVIAKYDSRGDHVWQTRRDEASGSGIEPVALAIDGGGHVLMVGSSDGPEGLQYLTLKMDPGGRILWASRHIDDERDALASALRPRPS